MPVAPPRVCSTPGCHTLTASGRGKCAKHLAEQRRGNWLSDKRRGTRQARGYGAAWYRVRKQRLEMDLYLCQICLRAAATQVDHIVPKAKGGADDIENLQSICTSCHATKTQLDSR